MQEEPIAGIWLLPEQPCMDKFQYQQLALTPTKAHLALQDMLLYIAVLDRWVQYQRFTRAACQ
jgi:hypothetical protein